MLLAQIPIVLILFITNFSAKMDITSGTLATLLFMMLAAVVIWLVRRYYQRHTYEPIKPFKRKDIMINIGWALLLRVIVIGMSFLMMVSLKRHYLNVAVFGYHLFYLHLFSLLNMVFQIG